MNSFSSGYLEKSSSSLGDKEARESIKFDTL